MKAHAPPENAKAARQGGVASQLNDNERSHAQEMRTSRKRPHGGYFRVSEEAVRLIHGAFDEPSAVRNATNVYITFCRKANLRGTTKFEDTIGNIAHDAAMQPRETQRAIRALEGAALIHVQRRKIGNNLNAPSIYAVVTMLPDATAHEHEATTHKHEATTSGRDSEHATSPPYSQELPQKPPIPSIQEAEEFLQGQQLPTEAVPEWHAHRASQNWQKTSGVCITDWRSDLKAWVYRNARTNRLNGSRPPEKCKYANDF